MTGKPPHRSTLPFLLLQRHQGSKHPGPLPARKSPRPLDGWSHHFSVCAHQAAALVQSAGKRRPSGPVGSGLCCPDLLVFSSFSSAGKARGAVAKSHQHLCVASICIGSSANRLLHTACHERNDSSRTYRKALGCLGLSKAALAYARLLLFCEFAVPQADIGCT